MKYEHQCILLGLVLIFGFASLIIFLFPGDKEGTIEQKMSVVDIDLLEENMKENFIVFYRNWVAQGRSSYSRDSFFDVRTSENNIAKKFQKVENEKFIPPDPPSKIWILLASLSGVCLILLVISLIFTSDMWEQKKKTRKEEHQETLKAIKAFQKTYRGF